MQALIDCDLVAYRAAASAEQEDSWIAVARADENMRMILAEVGATSFRGFLSGGDNFRKKIDPLYKANRPEEKPRHLVDCQTHLIQHWQVEVTDGIEADDALGINQTDGTVICSLDKDLLQIAGKHYRWQISGTVKGKQWIKPAEWHDISYIDGLRNFYASSLIGDTADNIVGVKGIGPKKAAQFLNDCSTEQQMFDVCRQLYMSDERYFRNLKLLWVLRTEKGIFDETLLLNGMDESEGTQLHSECAESWEPEVAPEV